MARPSTRSLAIALALVIGAGAGGLIAVALSSGSGDTTVETAPTSPTIAGSPSAVPPASSSTALTSTLPPSTVSTLIAPSPSTAPRTENRDPEAVARSFINGYLAWSWSDQPSPQAAMRQRVRPWVTDRFDAGLAQSSSAASATATRISTHEVNTVTIASLDQIAPATTDTMFLSLVTVNITKDGASPSKRSVYIQAKLLNVGGNWYVDELVR